MRSMGPSSALIRSSVEVTSSCTVASHTYPFDLGICASSASRDARRRARIATLQPAALNLVATCWPMPPLPAPTTTHTRLVYECPGQYAPWPSGAGVAPPCDTAHMARTSSSDGVEEKAASARCGTATKVERPRQPAMPAMSRRHGAREETSIVGEVCKCWAT
eukprot:2799165-Prymnesium_polylepis.3